MMCTFVGQLSMEIAFTTIVLGYGTELLLPFTDHPGDTRSDHLQDLLAFSVIVYLAVRFNASEAPIPSLSKVIIQDATYYFLVIFTSHFVVAMSLLFASVSTPS